MLLVRDYHWLQATRKKHASLLFYTVFCSWGAVECVLACEFQRMTALIWQRRVVVFLCLAKKTRQLKANKNMRVAYLPQRAVPTLFANLLINPPDAMETDVLTDFIIYEQAFHLNILLH